MEGDGVKIEPVTLPEFGLDLNWAVCRNPMCENFGRDLDVDLPEGLKQKSSARYTLKTKWRFQAAEKDEDVREARCVCRYCEQDSHILSNRAVRPIARYFLSLSLPFADCPNEACENHGINVFEHWYRRRHPSRRYRRHHARHIVRCRACQAIVHLGTTIRTRQDPETVRERWGEILEGLYARRSFTDTFELRGIWPGNYYSNLRGIGARVRDYHNFRNAHLLHPEGARRDEPARVYTDVLRTSLPAYREHRRHSLLDVIVSTMVADRKIFVLAAHPFFLPKRLCPTEAELKQDFPPPEFERKWCSLLHPDTAPAGPWLSGNKREKKAHDTGRGGLFIASPYAAAAHFLVVQKMLSRFQEIHCYMDGAKELAAAALVALRGRILAGGVGPESDTDQSLPPRQSAEIVLYQHKPKAPMPEFTTRKELDTAWGEMERRFDGAVKKAIKKIRKKEEEKQKKKKQPRLLGNASEIDESKVRADRHRVALHGAFSKDGRWAWLHHPPENNVYRRSRTLWVTRMPGKTFESHGKAALSKAMLQPVDSIMNSMRARIRSGARPLLRASGRSYRSNNISPRVVNDELSVYLLRQNYSLRRKMSQDHRIIPAAPWGLLDPEEPPLDVLACAWEFRLGIDHAALISDWQRM